MSLPSWDRIRSTGKLATITGERLQQEMKPLQAALAGLHLEPRGLTEISKTQDIIQSKVRSFERLGEAMVRHAEVLTSRGSEAVPAVDTKLEISRTAMDLKGAVTKLDDLSIFIDILQSELEVEAILSSRPDIDLKPLLTGIQDTIKQINESLAPLVPSQQHDRPIYLDGGIEFDRRLIETTGTNLIQLDGRDNPLGEWTDTFHTISTLIAFNDLEPAVKHQLGHHLCHMFFTNAFYRGDEIQRFGYQTTPLTLQREGGYLRGEITGITDAFKSILISGSEGRLKSSEMALASSANFEKVLGQLTKTVTAENRDQVATDIALKFMEGGGNLEEYPSLRSLVRIIVPFPSDGADKWGRFESATRAMQTEFTDLVLSKLQPILDESFTRSFAHAKAAARSDYDGQLAALRSPDGVLEGNIKFFMDFKSFLEKNQGSPAVAGMLESVPKIKAALSLKNPGQIEAAFKASFGENRDAVIALKAQHFESILQVSEARERQRFLDGFNAKLPTQLNTIMVVGDIVPLDGFGIASGSSIAALCMPNMSPGIENRMKGILGKSGYSPSPQDMAEAVLQGGAGSLRDFLLKSIEYQREHELGNPIIRDRLGKLIDHLHATDADSRFPTGLYPSVDELSVVKGYRDQLCSKLASGEASVPRILGDSIVKLLDATRCFEPGHLPKVVTDRIEDNLILLLKTDSPIEQTTRAIQNLHEAVIIAGGLAPNTNDWQSILKTDGFPVRPQTVALSEYGLRSFTQVYSAFESTRPRGESAVSILSNIYYESVEKFGLSGRVDGQIRLDQPRTVEEITRAGIPSLIVLDTHPNDAAKLEMSANDVKGLVQTLKAREAEFDKTTLVVDVTLNHYSELELKEIVAEAKALIDDGKLNLVFIQSATKFTQFGMDQFSGGLSMVFNNGEEKWAKFNDELEVNRAKEPIRPHIESYFKNLFEHTSDEQFQYIQAVRANTAGLRGMVETVMSNPAVQKMDRGAPVSGLEIGSNSDPSTCYLTLHYEDLITRVFGDDASDKDVDTFNKSVMHDLAYGLVEKLDLPMSLRMSFGFPISNMGDTGRTIRLTVGIEDSKTLAVYSKILGVVQGTLVNMTNPDLNDAGVRDRVFKNIVGGIRTIADLDRVLGNEREMKALVSNASFRR